MGSIKQPLQLEASQPRIEASVVETAQIGIGQGACQPPKKEVQQEVTVVTTALSPPLTVIIFANGFETITSPLVITFIL